MGVSSRCRCCGVCSGKNFSLFPTFFAYIKFNVNALKILHANVKSFKQDKALVGGGWLFGEKVPNCHITHDNKARKDVRRFYAAAWCSAGVMGKAGGQGKPTS